MKTDWSPTPESLDRLLLWLESDRDKAAQKYEKVRLRLIKFFSCDGCGDADEYLADKTFDRVMKKLDDNQVPEPFIGDKTLYFLGFARNIRLEHLRNLRRDDNHEPENDTNQKEHESWCLEECGRTLDPDENWLAVEYYRFEKAEMRYGR